MGEDEPQREALHHTHHQRRDVDGRDVVSECSLALGRGAELDHGALEVRHPRLHRHTHDRVRAGRVSCEHDLGKGGGAFDQGELAKDQGSEPGERTPTEMSEAGMVIAGDDIPQPYDRFRHRVIFPICDTKGRVVAFGGRALSPDQPAKYLNSPETPLFHKGHLLFNAHRARQPAFERSNIIVAEGYMDVIALAQAGHENAVAPLGTALTADQIELLWRMVPEPTLCFDGDSAGLKAANRAVDTALPHLKTGHSLRFAFLPDGLDPDDLIRQRGPDAITAVIEQAKPLIDVLWDREWGTGDWTTPERRCAICGS